MESFILSYLIFISPHYQIDPYLAASVIKTESRFDSQAVGSIGEIGLFQIRPEFSSYKKADLFNWKTNIKAGLEMLAYSQKKCNHKLNKTFVICHNRGKLGARKVKVPRFDKYYKKVYTNYLNYVTMSKRENI